MEQFRKDFNEIQDLIYNGSLSGLKLINELQINLYLIELWLKQDCGAICYGDDTEATLRTATQQRELVEILLSAAKAIAAKRTEIVSTKPKKKN